MPKDLNKIINAKRKEMVFQQSNTTSFYDSLKNVKDMSHMVKSVDMVKTPQPPPAIVNRHGELYFKKASNLDRVIDMENRLR